MSLELLVLTVILIAGVIILIAGVIARPRREARKRQVRQGSMQTQPTGARRAGRFAETSRRLQYLPQPELSTPAPQPRNVQPPHAIVSAAPVIQKPVPLIRKTTGPATAKIHTIPAIATSTVTPAVQKLHSSLIYARSSQGAPISSENRNEWLEARRWGVTATDVKKIVKLNGEPSVQRVGLLEKKLSGARDPDFAAFQHGRDREPIIAEWARQEFGVVHNQYLMCGTNSSHLATPDGHGEDFIVEIKTSVKELIPTSKMYRDQIQWQLHVTNTEKVLLIVENRYSLERDYMWVLRNEERIQTLTTHADYFLEELQSLRT